MGEEGTGDIICSTCRSQPTALVRALLERARRGHEDTAALRGFEFDKELGRGGMGSVCLIHQGTDRLAIKVMRPSVAEDRDARRRFLREIKISNRLIHPNVVRMLDVGYALGVLWYRMEYCDGGSVRARMTRSGGRLPLDEAVSIALQACVGLEYAHAEGVIHRDLKPSNLFLTGSEGSRRVKVADFGLARAHDLAGLTKTGDVLGSPEFMCRQQLIDAKRAGPEVDVWAMAATLYAMLTGKPPRDFAEGDRARGDFRMVILRTDPVPIRIRDPSIPPRLAQMIDQALTESPPLPFETAAAFRKALNKVHSKG
jgi:serine/threonine protein kinase